MASRCVKFRFKPIPREVQMGKLKEICRAENVRLDETDLMNLLEKGDLRQSINSLQSFHSLRTVPLNLLPTPAEYCKRMINSVFTASSVKQVYQISNSKLIKGKELGYDEYPMDEVLTGLIEVINYT